jgi:hypothetical protein
MGSGKTMVPGWRRLEGVPRAVHQPGLVSSRRRSSLRFWEQMRRAGMTFELLRTRRFAGERREGRSRMVRSVISLVARRRRRSRAESRGWAGEVAIRSWGMVRERRLFKSKVLMSI